MEIKVFSFHEGQKDFINPFLNQSPSEVSVSKNIIYDGGMAKTNIINRYGEPNGLAIPFFTLASLSFTGDPTRGMYPYPTYYASDATILAQGIKPFPGGWQNTISVTAQWNESHGDVYLIPFITTSADQMIFGTSYADITTYKLNGTNSQTITTPAGFPGWITGSQVVGIYATGPSLPSFLFASHIRVNKSYGEYPNIGYWDAIVEFNNASAPSNMNSGYAAQMPYGDLIVGSNPFGLLFPNMTAGSTTLDVEDSDGIENITNGITREFTKFAVKVTPQIITGMNISPSHINSGLLLTVSNVLGGSKSPDIVTKFKINDYSGFLVNGVTYTNPVRILGANTGSLYLASVGYMFKNGTISNATGFHDGFIQCQSAVFHKEKMLYGAPTITYSDASGSHSEFFPSSVFPSDPYEINVIDWNNEIIADEVSLITSLCEFKDFVVVGTLGGVGLLNYGSDGEPLPMQWITKEHGLTSHRGMKVVEGFIYWVNRSGVYKSDGITVEKISKAINSEWESSIRNNVRLYPNSGQGSLFFISYSEQLNTIFVSYQITSFGDGKEQVTYSYNILSGAWGKHNGCIRAISNVGESTYYFHEDGHTTLDSPVIPTVLPAEWTATTSLVKSCLLVPDFSKKADPVYARMLFQGCTAASQMFRVKTYWDGNASNNAQSFTYLVSPMQNLNTDGISVVKTPALGSGNILHVSVERDPHTHGAYPLNFIGLQIEHDIVEKGD